MRVLIETRLMSDGTISNDVWYPLYAGKVVAETSNRYGVKKHWYSRIDWVPKENKDASKNLCRAREIISLEDTSNGV